MKILLSTGVFMLAISTVNAGPGASRMATPEILQNTSRGLRMFDRFSHTRKSFVHTKLRTVGYEPKETPTTHKVHTLKLPKKLEYLDDTYEVFRTPPGFQEMLEESIKRSHTEKLLHEKKSNSSHRSR